MRAHTSESPPSRSNNYIITLHTQGCYLHMDGFIMVAHRVCSPDHQRPGCDRSNFNGSLKAAWYLA